MPLRGAPRGRPAPAETVRPDQPRRPATPRRSPAPAGNANHRSAAGKRALRGVGAGAAGPPGAARRGHPTARAAPRAARNGTGSASIRPGAAETSADAATCLLQDARLHESARLSAFRVRRCESTAASSRSRRAPGAPGTDPPKPRAAGPGGLLRSPKRIHPVGLRVTGRRALQRPSARIACPSAPGSALGATGTGPRAAHTGTVAVGGDCGDSSGNNTHGNCGPGVRSRRDWPGTGLRTAGPCTALLAAGPRGQQRVLLIPDIQGPGPVDSHLERRQSPPRKEAVRSAAAGLAAAVGAAAGDRCLFRGPRFL